MRKLLVATTNQGKLREYIRMLQGLPIDVVSLKDAGIAHVVDETGATIKANAILKAQAYAALSGLLTLADDSGLEVDALGGEPGPMSARYAGEEATPWDRNEYLLSKMANVPDDRRQARFRCVIAIVDPGSNGVGTSEGTCEGTISRNQVGHSGFGYDPVFDVTELNRRMAELTMDEKNAISHRGRAMEGAIRLIEARLAAASKRS